MLSDRNRFKGCKITFAVGRFQTSLYLSKEEYEQWKLICDRRIREIAVQEVDIDLNDIAGHGKHPPAREDE